MTTYSLERVIRKFFPITNAEELRNNTTHTALQQAPFCDVLLNDLEGKGFDGHSYNSCSALGCLYLTKTRAYL
jgi:hypothetical protein